MKLTVNVTKSKQRSIKLRYIWYNITIYKKEELGNEELFNELSEGKDIGFFIRRIAKMDRDVINDVFADFINDTNMNSMQIEFVQRLIDIIVEQGEINIEALMRGRAPFDRPKFFTLFGSEAQNRIFAVVRTINQNAKEAA